MMAVSELKERSVVIGTLSCIAFSPLTYISNQLSTQTSALSLVPL
ncbi:hypothetical protein [Cobetia sp. ICG0124]|nr:hypothetical protein [Cobetia sp. ICG0124]